MNQAQVVVSLLVTWLLIGALFLVAMRKLLSGHCWTHRWLPYRYSQVSRAMVRQCRACPAKQLASFEVVRHG
jgi:hypothetical protein